MKTPREILLDRHQAVEPKLDEIRHAVVADLSPAPSLKPQIPFVLKLWRELIWPCRRTWAGLATVWLTILVFNHSPAQRSHVAITKSTTPPGEMRLALQEQRLVLEEIIGPTLRTAITKPPRRPNNQPRSQLRFVGVA
jgi:hypothetical protein